MWCHHLCRNCFWRPGPDTTHLPGIAGGFPVPPPWISSVGSPLSDLERRIPSPPCCLSPKVLPVALPFLSSVSGPQVWQSFGLSCQMLSLVQSPLSSPDPPSPDLPQALATLLTSYPSLRVSCAMFTITAETYS